MKKPKFVLQPNSQVDFALLGVLKAQMLLNDNKSIQAYRELDDVKALLGSFSEGAVKKAKPKQIKCHDCGREYQAGAPHTMFCPAHTCSECGTSFGYVLPVYDSRVKPPIRKCDECLNEELSAEETRRERGTK